MVPYFRKPPYLCRLRMKARLFRSNRERARAEDIWSEPRREHAQLEFRNLAKKNACNEERTKSIMKTYP